MNNKLIIPVAALAFLGGTVAMGTVAAQSEAGTFPPMIENLVEKFNLNEEEVQTVLDDTRDEHRVQMQALYEERLSQAVIDGDITEEQKQLILEKRAELEVQFQAQQTELETWAKDNGIDLRYLGPFGGMHHGRFNKMMRMHNAF